MVNDLLSHAAGQTGAAFLPVHWQTTAFSVALHPAVSAVRSGVETLGLRGCRFSRRLVVGLIFLISPSLSVVTHAGSDPGIIETIGQILFMAFFALCALLWFLTALASSREPRTGPPAPLRPAPPPPPTAPSKTTRPLPLPPRSTTRARSYGPTAGRRPRASRLLQLACPRSTRNLRAAP